MIGAFWILLFTVIVGICLYIGEMRWRNKNKNSNVLPASDVDADAEPISSSDNEPEECCGLHLVCEKDSLSSMSADILYYDDEELDRFVGREADSYTPDEVEEFRDVLMTLREDDVLGWARSITQRHLELPTEVRDELIMIANEIRQKAG